LTAPGVYDLGGRIIGSGIFKDSYFFSIERLVLKFGFKLGRGVA